MSTERGLPSGFTCDKCQKPILVGDMVYTIATNDEMKTSRHASCQPTSAQLRKNTDDV